jgi:phage tail sheath gpL-like
VAVGDPLNVSVTIENTGDHGTVQVAEVRLRSGDAGVNATTAVDLGSTGSANTTVSINTTGLDPGNYTLEVVTEDDTAQMTVTVTTNATVSADNGGLSLGDVGPHTGRVFTPGG